MSFVMPTNGGDRIILTPAQVHELAGAPDELVNLSKAMEPVCNQLPHQKACFLLLTPFVSVKLMQVKYTGLGRFIAANYVESVVRTKLIRNLGKLTQLRTQYDVDGAGVAKGYEQGD